jgi:hypothetical protein
MLFMFEKLHKLRDSNRLLCVFFAWESILIQIICEYLKKLEIVSKHAYWESYLVKKPRGKIL